MVRVLALVAWLAVPSAALVLQTEKLQSFGSAVLDAGMRPRATAQLLADIEDTWKLEADAESSEAQRQFGKSCRSVADAVLHGSDGDHNRVQEYMSEVCQEDVLKMWQSNWCLRFKAAIGSGMMFNNYDNREKFNYDSFCSFLWKTYTQEEREAMEKQHEREKVERAEEEEADALAGAIAEDHADAGAIAEHEESREEKHTQEQNTEKQQAEDKEHEKELKRVDGQHAEEKRLLREANERAKKIRTQRALELKKWESAQAGKDHGEQKAVAVAEVYEEDDNESDDPQRNDQDDEEAEEDER